MTNCLQYAKMWTIMVIFAWSVGAITIRIKRFHQLEAAITD